MNFGEIAVLAIGREAGLPAKASPIPPPVGVSITGATYARGTSSGCGNPGILFGIPKVGPIVIPNPIPMVGVEGPMSFDGTWQWDVPKHLLTAFFVLPLIAFPKGNHLLVIPLPPMVGGKMTA